MHEEQFVNQVQTRTGLACRSDTERVIYATLEILGEQLPGNLVGPVAAALPERLGEHLWATRPRSRVTAAQAGRLSRGVARGEGSWPGDNTVADADIDNIPRQRA
jgi:uncharacterized protein (DUF2267 family)